MILGVVRIGAMTLMLGGAAASAESLDFSGSGADVPQAPGAKPEPSPRDPCEASVSEADGVVTLSLKDPARADSLTSLKLDDRNYSARFDAAGNLVVKAPMLHAKAEAQWIGVGGHACERRDIAFAEFPSIVLTALVWTGPYDLALHVVEPPAGSFGGPVGYIAPARPDADHAYGLGDLQVFGLPYQTSGIFGQGGTRVQLYTLPAQRNPRQGDLYHFVEFVSRGNPAKPPYCGTDLKLTVPYEIIHLDAGRIERRGGKFDPIACGTRLTGTPGDNANFQRWKWSLRQH